MRATLHCGAWASHCVGFSCCEAWALGAWASVVVVHGLSSCGARAYLLCGMWDLPGPGLEPVSLALAGRFLTTAPWLIFNNRFESTVHVVELNCKFLGK